MANATETAAKVTKAKLALAKALRQKNNENTAGFFAAGMVGMILLFMIFHWTRYLFKRYETEKGNATALRIPAAIARYLSSYGTENLAHTSQDCKEFLDTQSARLYLSWPCTHIRGMVCYLYIDYLCTYRLVYFEQLGKASGMVSIVPLKPCSKRADTSTQGCRIQPRTRDLPFSEEHTSCVPHTLLLRTHQHPSSSGGLWYSLLEHSSRRGIYRRMG